MPQTIDLDGVEYEFPDDATQEQITSYLRKVSPPNKVQAKAKANLAELTAAPVDRKRGLYAGADPTTEEPDLRGSGVGAAFEAGGQAFQRGVGRVAGNLAAVPSVFDRALDDVVIPSDGPMEGTSVRKGVPLFAGKRMLDAPQTDGGPAMLSGVADDLRHGLPEMPSGYSQALAKKNLWEKVQDPTWYADMLAGNAPQMGVSLAGGAIGGRPGAAAASGLMMAGDEFQRTQDYEEETGRRAEGAGAKALLSGGLQGALDSLVPGSIAAGGVKQEIGALIGTVLKEGGTEALQKLISDAISPAEQRSFGERMTDPKYLMDLAEEGVAGGIMGGAMHPLGQSGLRPTQPNSQTLKRTPSPADIIEGRDGATGMQPVDMKVPVEKGPSAAVAPNPDRSARIIPVGAPVPDGMGRMTVDGGVLIYDRATNPSFAATRDQVSTPEGLAAFLEANGTPAASGQPSTTNAAQAAPPPLLVPPVAQTDAEVAEIAKQIAARPAPPKALEPEEVAKKIERLVADPRTTPEEREILVAKYEQLTKVVQQRGQEAAVAKEMGPQEEPLDAGLSPPESDPYSDDFYLAEALRATEQSAGRTDRLGAPRPYGEQAVAAPEDMAPLEEPPVEIPPAAIAERQRLEAAAQAERNPAPVEQVLSEVPPEAVAQAVEALAPPPSEAPGTSFAERQKAKRAEPKVTTPVADQKAAAAFTPVQLKQAEQLVKLAYHSEKTADGPTERTRAEREVEREEKRAREMGIDVDAISRSVGREPTGSDGNALPTVAKVVPESAEVTPQVTAETSPFMQARRAAEAAAAKEAKPEPKKKAAKSRVSAEVEANMLGDVEDAAAGNGNQFQDAAGRLATSERKARTVGIDEAAIAAARARGEAKATGKTKKAAKPDTPKTVEKKLAAAVAKEKALRAKRDADPENEALLDEYNEATAELYALTKEANGKGVSTLAVTTDDDTPSLMKTIPQREARTEAFGNKPTMTREAFDKALEDAKKRLPGIAHLVDALNSQADLPASVAAVANGDRIDGFTQNGRVAVVADGMTSPEHVAATLAHEAVGHLVPEAVFGKNEWRKRLNDMMASSQWFRDFVANFGKSETGRRYPAAELASEAIAFEANRVLDDANYKPPNAYRMFIAKLREWLREAVGARRVIGLSKVLEFSDRDLAAFIARSKRTAETGLPKNRRKGDRKPSFAKAVPGATEPVATAYSEADLIDVPPIEGFDRVRRAMEDDMLALRRAEEAADKRGTSREEISMYKASDERHGKAATEIQDVRSQFVTPIIKMAHKAGVTLDEIGDWLYAVHAISRNAEGRKRDPGNPEPFSGMSDADARAKLVALEPKAEALNEIAEVVYAMLAYERKRIVEAGLATKEEVEGWRKTWGSTYVPLQHQEMDEARSGNARGYNVLRRAAKQATGRRTEADNPLFSAISQVQRSITRAHNAEVGRQFDLFVQANPNPEYWIRNPKPKTKTLKTKENEDGELETKVVTVAEPTFMRDDILHVKDKDGNDVEIQILHPDVLRAMTRAMSGLGNSNAEKAVAFASAFTRIYGGLLTQYNLEFLISNPARDVQGAAANIAVGYGQSTDKSGRKKSQIVKTAAKVIGQYGRSAKGIVQFMRDPDSKDEYAQLYAQMRREGATVGWAPFEDPNKIKNQIQSDMNSLKRGALHPKEWLKKANEAIHAANTIAENATRLSVYKTLGDLGITGRERVRITKNSTVNFNRRGEYGPIFNAAYMFGQVGVSAPAAMLGFVKRSPKRAAQVAATLAMAGWAEGFLNILFAGDDDDDGYSNYEELMESEKSRNWIFGKKKFPLGHGWSFFVNFGRHVAETQFGPREIKDLPGATFTNLMDSFNPLGASADPVQAAMPWFLDPMVQHYGNKTTFGAPIYPPDPAPGQPTVPDSRRHFRSAPKWATSAAEGLSTITGGDGVKEGLIEVSPETLQFYYDFATQGAVKLMTRTLAAAHNAATGTETRTSDIPFVRRLATSEHPSVDRGRYIRQKQELTDAYDRAKKYKGLGPKGEADKNLDRYNELLAGPLRSRSDFMKLDKLYAQLDDAEGPEVDALKKRVIAVAGRQYELSKKVDKYIALDDGLLADIEEKVEALSPKKEKVEAKEEIEEDLEGR